MTGASRGIGRAVVAALAERGFRVAATASNASRLEELARQSGAMTIAADLRSDAESIVPRMVERMGGVDALVSCAGVAHHGSLESISSADIDEHYEINVRAPLILSRDVARDIRARDAKGAIIHIASSLALRGAPTCSVYAATKGAIVSMTRSLALELAPSIRVNCVAPGGVDTEMIADRRDALAALHPLGRNGRPDEVADAVLYLLSAEFATGTILTLDGGLTA